MPTAAPAAGSQGVTDKAAVFAIGRPTGARGLEVNPFAGTVDVTLPATAAANFVGLHVFAADARRVARCVDEATGRAIYLVGRAAHALLEGEALLRWLGQAAAEGPEALREVLGAFVVLVDDRRNRRVSFANDAMNLLPWFVGSSGGRLVAGTGVLDICEAGLSGGRVDYDAVASWLCYNFVCTGGSVVTDYRRVARGAVSTFHPAGGLVGLREYAPARYGGGAALDPDELVARQLAHVRAAFGVLTRGVDEVNLPLSGGYDSRLMCALAAERGRPRVRATVVRTTRLEAELARQVADVFGIPLDVLPVRRSKIDLFDDPLYVTPEGLPMARNLTNAVARLHPGVPVLSGYLGDGVMRGSLSAAGRAYLAQDDDPTLTDEFLAAKAHTACRILQNKLHLLRDGLGARAEARCVASLARVIRGDGRASGRPLAHLGLFVRQPVYFANIVQSHRGVADALTPFAAWRVIDFHARHVASLTSDTYDRLYKRFYPALGHIPQEYLAATARGTSREVPADDRPTRHLRRWGSELLRGVPRKWSRTAIEPRKLLKRLPGALLAQNGDADAVGYMHRIHSFEQRLERAGVEIDWGKL
jgi:hypothetical protein